MNFTLGLIVALALVHAAWGLPGDSGTPLQWEKVPLPAFAPSPVRFGHCSVLIANRYILLYGGRASASNVLGDFWGYDTVTNVWISLPNDPGLRTGMACAVLNGTAMVFAGGARSQTGGTDNPILDIWLFRINRIQASPFSIAGAWDYISNGIGNFPREEIFANMATTLVNDTMYFWGGITYFADEKRSLYAFNFTQLKWTEIDFFNPPRSTQMGTMVYSPAVSQLVLFDGAASGVAGGQILDILYGYDFKKQNFSPLLNNQSPSPALFGHTANILWDTSMIVFGGGDSSNRLYWYNFNSGTWYMKPVTLNGLASRRFHSANLVGSVLYVFFGGTGAATSTNEWDMPVYFASDMYKIDLTTPVLAANTTLSCSAPSGQSNAIAGETITCTIVALDTFGDVTGCDAYVSAFTISSVLNGTAQQQPSVSPLAWSPALGMFTFTTKSMVAGSVIVSVKYAGETINFQKPAVIVVSPLAPVASFSSLECAAVAVYQVRTTCLLHLRDRFGNPSGLFDTLPSLSSLVTYLGSTTCGNSTTEKASIVYANAVGEFNLTFSSLVVGLASISTVLSGSPLTAVTVDVRAVSCPPYAQLRDENATVCECGAGYESANPQSAQPENYCQPCQGGQRKAFVGNQGCKCDVGFYNASVFQNSLLTCVDLSDSVIYSPPKRWFVDSNPCVPCPPCVDCSVQSNWTPMPGFWLGHSSNVYSCVYNPNACLGNSSLACAVGYTGPLCAICDEGYSGYGRSCAKCGSAAGSWVVAIVGLALVIFFVAVLVKLSSRPKSRMSITAKILLNFLQVLALIGSFKQEWPQAMDSFLSFAGVSNVGASVMIYSCVMARMDHFDWLAVYISLVCACVVPSIAASVYNRATGNAARQTTQQRDQAYQRFLGEPVSVSFSEQASEGGTAGDDDDDHLLGGSAVILDRDGVGKPRALSIRSSTQVALIESEVDPYGGENPAEPLDGKSEHSAATAGTVESVGKQASLQIQIQRTWWETYMASALVVLFMLYPTVTKHLLESLQCETVDGVPYLAVDFTIRCDSSRYKSWVYACWLFLIGFSFGLLAYAFLSLFRKRHILNNFELNRHIDLRFLFDGFKGRLWFYELVITTRKIAIVLLAVFITNAIAQTVAGTLILVAGLTLQLLLRPYIFPRVNHLESAALVLNICTLSLSSFFNNSVSLGKVNTGALTAVLVLANTLFVLFLVALIVKDFYALVKAGVQSKLKTMGVN